MSEVETIKFKCDDCADAEGGSGLPCILESCLLNEANADALLCPVSGEECNFEVVRGE